MTNSGPGSVASHKNYSYYSDFPECIVCFISRDSAV